MASRTQNTRNNIIYSYISSIVSIVLGFVSRTIFIKILSVDYLGVNGLFTEVLGVLSFAELGLSGAINFALYKPVATGDNDTVKSLVLFYKKAYYVVAAVIATAGLALLPFLDKIVKDPGNVGNIRVYYLIFLFNTTITYFVTYKYSLVNAYQKTFQITRIDTIATFSTTVLQIVFLAVTRNYLVYLLVSSVMGLAKIFWTSVYLDKKYPILKEKDAKPLPKETKNGIRKNVTALIWHKIGDVAIHQTDNIIISAVLNIATVGLMSNYNMILTKVTTFIKAIFNSALPSLGNLVATEDQDKRVQVYKVYNFLNFWIYGFSALAFFFLLSPTIELWLGKEMLISNGCVFLICFNLYLAGQRIAFLNYKTAFGVFSDDQFVVLIAAGINLVVSIVCAKLWGLIGVFVGTVVSSLFQSITRPIIAYKRITGEPTWKYFWCWGKYLGTTVLAGTILFLIFHFSFHETTFFTYFLRILIVAIVPNVLYFVLYHKTTEYEYLRDMLKNRLFNRKRKQNI